MGRTYFEAELDALMRDTLTIGHVVADALEQALQAIMLDDLDVMDRVVANDSEINHAVERLHGRCLT